MLCTSVLCLNLYTRPPVHPQASQSHVRLWLLPAPIIITASGPLPLITFIVD